MTNHDPTRNPTGPPSFDVDQAGRDGSTCPVCPHRWVDHDAISRRFCSATIAGGSGHGCVCTPPG